jgi:hypothetical protein
VVNILICEVENRPKIQAAAFEKMNIHEILLDERDFRVIVNGHVFFDQALFPILELVQYCQLWLKTHCLKNNSVDFIYNTVESSENPLLTFQMVKNGWKLESVWQKFECDEVFSYTEVKNFVYEIVSKVLNSVETSSS